MLEQYTAEVLRHVITVVCAVTLGAYSLPASAARVTLWRELTIIPLMLVLLRYGRLVASGSGGARETALFGDGFVWLGWAAWLVSFGFGV